MDHVEPSSLSAPPLRGWRNYTPQGAYFGDPSEPPTRRARLIYLFHELRANRRALSVFANSRFRATYRAQALGILWPMANPLILMVVMSFVFGVIFKTDIKAYPVFLMLGLVLWHFVTHSWTGGTQCLVQHAAVVKRTSVPSYVVTAGTVFSHLYTLGFASLSMIPLVAFYPDAFQISIWLVLVPVLIGFVVMTMLGLTLATSVLNVIYRDVGYLVDSLLLVLFWATPIVWPLEKLPKAVHAFLLLNPIAACLHCLRDIVMKGALPPLKVFGVAAVTSFATLIIGIALHRKYDAWVTDHV
jgi:homopolymeric O-antigen transport system permease protein